MVLSLKTWKSRSLPGLPRTVFLFTIYKLKAWCESHFLDSQRVFALRLQKPPGLPGGFSCFRAGAAAYSVSHLPFTSVHGERIKPKRRPRSDSHRIKRLCSAAFWSESKAKLPGAKCAVYRWWQPD